MLLRAVDYRDADRIVTLLTEEFGKISALARGARRSRKRFGGALEPYALLQVELSPGRGELYRLAQASLARPFVGVLASLEKIGLASAALELVRETSPEREPDARSFEAAIAVLERLDQEPADESILLSFFVRWLALIGWAPGFERCAGCGKSAAAGQAALFDPTREAWSVVVVGARR